MQSCRNNKGVTLVELIIGIAISSIITLIIVSFINGASESFRRANDEVNLQVEAQRTINLLNNQAMEAKDIYEVPGVGIESQRYVIEASNSKFQVVLYVEADKKLYIVDENSGVDAAARRVDAETKVYDINSNFEAQSLLAEYVKTITISSLDAKNRVSISLTLELGDEEYAVTKKVKLRNAP